MFTAESLPAVALQTKAELQTKKIQPSPSHRLVGDHQLHHRKCVEDCNGGYVPEGGRAKVRLAGSEEPPSVVTGVPDCVAHSPEVNLVLFPQNTFVLSCQISHTEVLLRRSRNEPR